MTDWIVTPADRELFDRELNTFVPPRIFDAHAHWYHRDHFPAESAPGLVTSGPAHAGHAAFQELMGQITPGRRTEGLFFPYPFVGLDIAAANQFLADELQHDSGSRGQMLVTPDMDPEFIRDVVQRYRFVGLKCYHIYSSHRPTFDSPIEEYLPEPQVRLAHELGLSVTLHIVRSRALADRVNTDTIQRYCRAYPNFRLILAHSARGFNPHHTLEGIGELKGLPNVWCDTSAITDSGAHEAIIRELGHTQLLYGSDFPVSHIRGRCIGVGDSFFWLTPQNAQLNAAYGTIEPTLVGLEALRTLKLAAFSTGLSDSQVEDVFCHNARRLFGLE